MRKSSIRVGESFIIAVNEGNVNMTIAELTKRVSELEGQVKKLQEQARPTDRSSQDNWLAKAGMFKDDPLFEEAIRLGRRMRNSTATESKSKKSKRVTPKSTRRMAG